MPYTTIPFSVDEYADLICISTGLQDWRKKNEIPPMDDPEAVQRLQEHMDKVKESVSPRGLDHGREEAQTRAHIRMS
jgi:hypothetical protein